MITINKYVKAENLQEAYELNQKRANRIVGGMMWLRLSSAHVQTAIDLSGLNLNSIEETEESFSIGCMSTLRDLELHKGLQAYFGGVIKECVRHIVGVQFRNQATIGGTLFGRYGFSDVLTCLMVLDTYVELYKGGMVPLTEFVTMKRDNDILIRVIIKKDGRKATYMSQRQTATDFPIIACSAAKKNEKWYTAIGARPMKAVQVCPQQGSIAEMVEAAVSGVTFSSNMRGSGAYREALAKVLLKRAMLAVEGGN